MEKVYHFHLSVHEAIQAEHETAARAELADRWPFDHDRFEMTDAQDVPSTAAEDRLEAEA